MACDNNPNSVPSLQPEEERTAQSIKDIKIGAIDPRGYLITDVFWMTKDYVIFKAAGRISPMFSDDCALSEKQRKNYMQLGQGLTRINTLEPGRLIRRNWLARLFCNISSRQYVNSTTDLSHDYFNREIARSIALCLDDMKGDAQEILTVLEKKIVNLKQLEHRIFYLLACFVLMAVYIIAVMFVTYAKEPGEIDVSNIVLLRATAFGALAGFFSVSIGIKQMEFDLDARGWMTVVYGFIRLLIAIISSVFVYFAIKSGMVFANLKLSLDNSDTYATLYVFSFLSGFSEHFVPNILKTLGQSQSTAGSQSNPSRKKRESGTNIE